MHMACAVEGAEEGAEGKAATEGKEQQGGEEVTFLYRLTQGGY